MAAAAFTLSGVLMAASAVPAAAALVEQRSSDVSSESVVQVDRLNESSVVSNDYLIIEHSVDSEAAGNLRVGREVEWNLSLRLNPEMFTEEDGSSDSERAELRTSLGYDSDFTADIVVESDHPDSETSGVPASVEVQPDTSPGSSKDQVGVYQVGAEDTVDVSVILVPGSDLLENQEMDLTFSVSASGNPSGSPDDDDEEEPEDDSELEVTLPGGNDNENTPVDNAGEEDPSREVVEDEQSVSDDNTITPPVVSDRDNAEPGAERSESRDLSREQADPVEIATGFLDEFKGSAMSMVLFFVGLLVAGTAFVLRARETKEQGGS